MTGARKPSLYSDERVCWFCKTPFDVECHHVFGGVGRRQVSDREGCYLYLCHEHHQGNTGVHRSSELMDFLHSDCQERWMRSNDATEEDFVAMFGRSYL